LVKYGHFHFKLASVVDVNSLSFPCDPLWLCLYELEIIKLSAASVVLLCSSVEVSVTFYSIDLQQWEGLEPSTLTLLPYEYGKLHGI